MSLDPEAGATPPRRLTKIDCANLSEGFIPTIDFTPTLPDLGDTSREAEALRKRLLTNSVHLGDMSKGPDTHHLSGVKALEAESMEIVARVDQMQIFAPGYDVEKEGAELVERLGLQSETPASVSSLDELEWSRYIGKNRSHAPSKTGL